MVGRGDIFRFPPKLTVSHFQMESVFFWSDFFVVDVHSRRAGGSRRGPGACPRQPGFSMDLTFLATGPHIWRGTSAPELN